ncbi:MAG: hypothetical protein D6737_12315 [Chloroflexi bacterium]|nr:MAG: hypothetical protein CUN54_01555 [Phototrophicales bacterium]RMF79205.1 MAG: hypothetical protein D6737_12315 [Chloroflexota bacterium]
MNILGVGTAEFILILLIMLIVAGPKRMAQWAYQAGRYTAKFRLIWAETMQMLENELNESGVDVKLPREMPTRSQLNAQIGKALEEVSQPVKETVAEVDAQLKEVEKAVSVNGSSTREHASSTTSEDVATDGGQEHENNTPDFGTWSGGKLDD